MTARTPAPRNGIAGVLLVFSIAALLTGLGFDLGAGAHIQFWIADQPGAAAAMGVASAVCAVVLARLMRLVLARESSDAGADA